MFSRRRKARVLFALSDVLLISLAFAAAYETRLLLPLARQFFMTGLCGGYTTFSSFSLQTLNLARDGEWLQAGANTVGSVVACLVAVWLGHLLAAHLNQLKGI